MLHAAKREGKQQDVMALGHSPRRGHLRACPNLAKITELVMY
jgi:hypothetical protein